jgi:hypothetical protein
VAFRTTDFERSTAEAGASRHSDSFKALSSMSFYFGGGEGRRNMEGVRSDK